MSFIFALAQLFTFNFVAPETVPGFDDRPAHIEATPSKSDLLQRPRMSPCTGTACR